MEITLHVPNPKFKIGQVIERNNKNNSKKIILLINGINMHGLWKYPENEVDVSQAMYTCIVQENSIPDEVDKYSNHITPGTIIYSDISFTDSEFIICNDKLKSYEPASLLDYIAPHGHPENSIKEK